MMQTFFMLASLSGLIIVLASIMIALTPGPRRHRYGITALMVWAYWGLAIYGLRALGEPLPLSMWFPWWGPAGAALTAWALWDVSRLTRVYGTTTLERAADIARGFLHSPAASDAMWSAWANALPLAAWVKGPDGVMLAINKRYETEYAVDAKQYVGDTDKAQWGDEIGKQFSEHDHYVIQVGQPVVFREPAPHWGAPERTALFLKFPMRDRRGRVIGVGGTELIPPPTSESHA